MRNAIKSSEKAQLICASLSEKIKENFKDIDIILSPAIGGIVVGYEIGRQLKVRTIFAERPSKKLQLRRGFNLEKNSNTIQKLKKIILKIKS